jgi:hypothetical protein
MPKRYFCKEIKDNKQCGETNLEKFEKGRYSTCKDCKSKYVLRKITERKNLELFDKVRRIDPEEEIRTVVDYALNIKSFDGDFSIVESIKNINEDNRKILEKINTSKVDKSKLFQNFDDLESKYDQVKIVFNIMKEKIESLESEVSEIKISEIKRKSDEELILNRIKDLENARRDYLDEKIKNQK